MGHAVPAGYHPLRAAAAAAAVAARPAPITEPEQAMTDEEAARTMSKSEYITFKEKRTTDRLAG
jgi:hypothetical protein